MSLSRVAVRAEGDRVLVIKDGRAVFEMPWQAALDLAQALAAKGKQAEEFAKANTIIADQALLARLGARFGLTSNPVMQHEAMKKAAWDRTLRRALPGGLPSQEVVGVPALRVLPPKKEDIPHDAQ
jgi:hypothetical protein